MAAHDSPEVDTDIETVRVRRSPKYGAFLAAGAAVGVLVAAILTFALPAAEPAQPGLGVYSTGQIFAFLALACAAVGLAVGGLVALLVDRGLSRRTRTVTATHEIMHTGD